MASTFSSCLSASNWSFETFFFGGSVLKDLIFLLVLRIFRKESFILIDFMFLPGIRILSYFASLGVNHLDVKWSKVVSFKCKCYFVFLLLETKPKKSLTRIQQGKQHNQCNGWVYNFIKIKLKITRMKSFF